MNELHGQNCSFGNLGGTKHVPMESLVGERSPLGVGVGLRYSCFLECEHSEIVNSWLYLICYLMI